jgi:hypothetical protein
MTHDRERHVGEDLRTYFRRLNSSSRVEPHHVMSLSEVLEHLFGVVGYVDVSGEWHLGYPRSDVLGTVFAGWRTMAPSGGIFLLCLTKLDFCHEHYARAVDECLPIFGGCVNGTMPDEDGLGLLARPRWSDPSYARETEQVLGLYSRGRRTTA